MSFYRAQFEDVVTADAINKFKEEYQGGDEEREALLDAYAQFEGDMNKVYQVVMLSDPLEDEERFRKIIDEAIEKGEVEAYKKYTEESEKSRKKRMENAKRDGKAARELAKKLGVEDKLFGDGKGKKAGKGGEDAGGEAALAALIQNRQKQRGSNFLADLEAKYAPKKGKKRGPEDEPSEEAFQKNAAKGKGRAKKVKESVESEPEAEPSSGTRRSKRAKK